MQLRGSVLPALTVLLRHGKLSTMDFFDLGISSRTSDMRKVRKTLLSLPGIYKNRRDELITFHYILTHRIEIFIDGNGKTHSLLELPEKLRKFPSENLPKTPSALTEYFTP